MACATTIQLIRVKHSNKIGSGLIIMKGSGFRRISTMSNSYQIEGHTSNLWGCDGSTSQCKFNNQSVPVYLDPNNSINDMRANDNLPKGTHGDVVPASTHSNFVQSSEGSDSPDDLDFSDEVLKYISHILMEEDVEEKTCMFQESAALEAAEKSFKEVIGEQSPLSIDHRQHHSSNFYETFQNNHPDGNLLVQSGPQYSYGSSSSSNTIDDSPVSTLRIPDMFSDSQSAMQFKKGVEEASKFLPNRSTLLLEGSVKVENNVSRGKKNPHHDSLDERSSKQSAIYTETTVISDMFDKVLLCSGGKNESDLREALNEITKNTQLNDQLMGSNGGKTGNKKKQGRRNVVDMRTLLTLCAEAVAVNNRRAVNDLLKQIRQHATPTGDGMQRLAYYFANGLEARMAGSGTQIYTSLINISTSAADILKAYHIYLATCPFRKISNFFANKTIRNLSEKATKLHIIDFGILYGFQWPCFFQYLALRHGGPPSVRITGIDYPCPGFRPSERVEETGRRLASYAETFKVPFEFHAIAQRWETIKLEDLKIKNDEFLAVSCLFRFRSLLDETVLGNDCPRIVVLNLIRRMNPAVFVQGIVNGAYNAPFFLTRFREALFHYSSFFDMLDANIPREVHERMLLEKTVFGREAMNVIACEGGERIERPETYKNWQGRITRVGFRQLPLDKDIVRLARKRVESSYHKDFVIDEDGQWLLQGWKGRIVYALSSWTPAY